MLIAFAICSSHVKRRKFYKILDGVEKKHLCNMHGCNLSDLKVFSTYQHDRKVTEYISHAFLIGTNSRHNKEAKTSGKPFNRTNKIIR